MSGQYSDLKDEKLSDISFSLNSKEISAGPILVISKYDVSFSNPKHFVTANPEPNLTNQVTASSSRSSISYQNDITKDLENLLNQVKNLNNYIDSSRILTNKKKTKNLESLKKADLNQSFEFKSNCAAISQCTLL